MSCETGATPERRISSVSTSLITSAENASSAARCLALPTSPRPGISRMKLTVSCGSAAIASR